MDGAVRLDEGLRADRRHLGAISFGHMDEMKIGVCLRPVISQYQTTRGPVAQLIERVVRNDEVDGLIPFRSTILWSRFEARIGRGASLLFFRPIIFRNRVRLVAMSCGLSRKRIVLRRLCCLSAEEKNQKPLLAHWPSIC